MTVCLHQKLQQHKMATASPSAMLVDGSPSVSKAGSWQHRVYTARYNVIAMVGFCLVYLIYSSGWHFRTRSIDADMGSFTRSTAVGNIQRKPAFTMLDQSMRKRIRMPPKASSKYSSPPYKVYMGGSGGRFGNKIFEYAAVYSIARMNNRTALTHTTRFNELRAAFANLSIPVGKPLPRMKTISHSKSGTYDRKFERLPNCNVQLRGYFQSWKFFQKYETDLRREFTLNGTLKMRAADYLRRIAVKHYSTVQYKNITFVGVHVRRGDKVRSKKFTVASVSYITRAMNDFRRNFTRVHFIVCSDGVNWCKENLRQEKNVSFPESRSPIMDFAILTLCNHTLATVGSFSWWAGWLAGGVTTYYEYYAKPNTSNYNSIKANYYFPPNWIPMSD